MKEDKKFPLVSETTDAQELFDNLNDNALKEVEDILAAYSDNQIDIKIPEYDEYTGEFLDDFELIINDSSYVENGNEILVLRWYEDYEFTEHLIECLSLEDD